KDLLPRLLGVRARTSRGWFESTLRKERKLEAMERPRPPKGARYILPTLWHRSGGFGDIDIATSLAVAEADYAAGHRFFITTGGSGSGYDMGVENRLRFATEVSDRFGQREDICLYMGVAMNPDDCVALASPAMNLPGYRGMLVLPNGQGHPHQ